MTARRWIGRMATMGMALLLAVVAANPAREAAAADPTAPPKARPARTVRKPPAPQLPASQLVVEPAAMALLKATADRLAAAKSMSFTAVASYEYPSKYGPPISYAVRYDVAMQRPDKLRVVIPGDGPASEFTYDGKTMTAYAPVENLAAVAPAPPTLDAALKQAFDAGAIYFPFTDLVAADPYAALTDDTILAFVIGPSGVVEGTRTDMVAWANKDVFLQIWIGADDKLPRRVRATYAADPLALRHELVLSNWRLDPTLAVDSFTAPKAASAPRIAFANPGMMPPPGVKPLGQSKPAPARKPAPKSP